MKHQLVDEHSRELQEGERFAFGKNWSHFLEVIDRPRIEQAVRSLREMLEVDDLRGRTFLDVGCGSGLFSLAARELGARVHSFDYDPQCVRCAEELRRRFRPDDEQWTVEHGSVLDASYLNELGAFDIVYSWGVLHQTGDMWQALDNVHRRVRDGGKLFISIYNDQGGNSRRWLRIKQVYNRAPRPVQLAMVLAVGAWWETRGALIRLVRLQNPLPFRDWQQQTSPRGMSVWHDLVDWVGGYPFEVARPDEIVAFFRQRKFSLLRLKTVGSGHGCNEYVFVRAVPGESPSAW